MFVRNIIEKYRARGFFQEATGLAKVLPIHPDTQVAGDAFQVIAVNIGAVIGAGVQIDRRADADYQADSNVR